MPEIKKVVVTAMIEPENKEKLRAALAPAEVVFCMPYGPGAKEKIAEASRDLVALYGAKGQAQKI